jgi:hypothetical protein
VAPVPFTNPVLITCEEDNTGSRKVIEANGGVLEDSRHGKLRFWAPTSAAVGAGTEPGQTISATLRVSRIAAQNER